MSRRWTNWSQVVLLLAAHFKMINLTISIIFKMVDNYKLIWVPQKGLLIMKLTIMHLFNKIKLWILKNRGVPLKRWWTCQWMTRKVKTEASSLPKVDYNTQTTPVTIRWTWETVVKWCGCNQGQTSHTWGQETECGSNSNNNNNKLTPIIFSNKELQSISLNRITWMG